MGVLGYVISCMVAALLGFLVAVLCLASHANGLEEECSRLTVENDKLRKIIDDTVRYCKLPSVPIANLIHQEIIKLLHKGL